MYLGKYNWNYITIVVSGLCIIVSYPEYTYPTVLSQKTVINGILAPGSKLRNHLLVGGLEHVLFVHILGISSSQLTNSIIFQRGSVETTNQFERVVFASDNWL